MNLEDMNLQQLIELRKKVLLDKKDICQKIEEVLELKRNTPKEDKSKISIIMNEYDKLSNKRIQINKNLGKIEELILFKKAPIVVGDRIELRKISDNINGSYSIFLKDKNIYIGYITYRGYHKNLEIGDIGYVISEEYRGNNYAFEALTLLGDLLHKNGIMDFRILCDIKNVASRKTIKKYGASIKKIKLIDGIVSYECKTKEIEKTSSKMK